MAIREVTKPDEVHAYKQTFTRIRDAAPRSNPYPSTPSPPPWSEACRVVAIRPADLAAAGSELLQPENELDVGWEVSLRF